MSDFANLQHTQSSQIRQKNQQNQQDPPQVTQVIPTNPIISPQQLQQDNEFKQIQKQKNIFLILIAAVLILAILLLVNRYLSNSQYNKNLLQYRKIQGEQYQQDRARYYYYKLLNKIFKQSIDKQALDRKINQFTDMTKEQFQQQIKILNQLAEKKQIDINQLEKLQRKTINWQAQLPKIKQINSSQCQSQYAYAVTGAVQALLNINNLRIIQNQKQRQNQKGKQFNKSKQKQQQIKFQQIILADKQIVDCCKNCGGCRPDSTSIKNALQYIVQNGITNSSVYQSSNKQEICTLNKQNKYKIKGFRTIKKGSCQQLVQILKFQPVIVSVDARNWKQYDEGNMVNCGRKTTSYGLLVGKFPGDETSSGYWIVRMPWSRRWGDRGYIKLQQGNTCGLCDGAFYPYL